MRNVRRSTAVTLAVAVLVALAPVGTPAADADLVAQPPPVTVTAVRPVEAGAVLVQRSAGPAAGVADGWRLNMDVALRNDGPEDLTLEQVRISYSGGSNPPDLVVATDPDSSAPWVIARNPRDTNAAAVVPAETILAGPTSGNPGNPQLARVPEDRVLPFLLPSQVTVEFTFEGFGVPVSVTRDLVAYEPPGGPLAFPFAATDLGDDEYVGTAASGGGQNHEFGTAHRRSRSQRFAYDFDVRRWDGSAWARLDGPAADNESYFIWGTPVHAMADGVVVQCNRVSPDNPGAGQSHPDRNPDNDPDFPAEDLIPGGGNSFWIQHAPGESTLYAHFKEGSIPAELCPEADDDEGLKYPFGVPGTEIKAGQFLGEVGNSGSSSNPHIHLHTQTDAPGTGTGGRPMPFHNIRVLDADAYNPGVDDDPAWNSVTGAAVTVSGQTVNGTQIGGFASYGTVNRMLIDPRPRVNLEVTKADDADPVAAGTDLTYTLTVTNHGPEAATAVTLADFLPPEVDFVSDDGGCAWTVGPARFCVIDDLAAGEQAPPITMVVAVPHDLVYGHGGPLAITNRALAASASDVFEATPGDNEAELATLVIAEADLEVVDVEVVDAPPAQPLIGEDATVGLRTTITNHGPSWPTDARVRMTPSAQTGLATDPTGAEVVAEAVQPGEQRELDEEFALTCQEPGPQQVTFVAEVEPAHPDDVDPDLSNNTGEVTVEVECVVPIAINIRPGNPNNQIQPSGNGVIPVAALTTEAGEYGLPVAFDAARIDPDTVRFGQPDSVWADTGGAPVHGNVQVTDAHEPDDQTKDGDLDMVLRFRMSQTGVDASDEEACMKGLYDDHGQQFTFFGCDVVQVKP